MVHFLAASSEPTLHESPDSLVLSKDKKAPIALVRDDEHADRFFLVVGAADNPVARFALAGADVSNISRALEQILEDLDE